MPRLRRLLLCVLPAVLVVSACHKETEEDKVKNVITAVQTAAEDKKVLAVLQHISKTYQDKEGRDYDAIKGLLAFYFFQHQKVGVLVPAIDVALNGPTATARFQAILSGRGTGSTAGSVLPEALGAYDFEVSFRKEEGAWKVVSAAWVRAGAGNGGP